MNAASRALRALPAVGRRRPFSDAGAKKPRSKIALLDAMRAGANSSQRNRKATTAEMERVLTAFTSEVADTINMHGACSVAGLGHFALKRGTIVFTGNQRFLDACAGGNDVR